MVVHQAGHALPPQFAKFIASARVTDHVVAFTIIKAEVNMQAGAPPPQQ